MIMAKHIGIVACSAEGAALCYRTICNEGERFMGRLDHPEISMHTHSLGKYDEALKVADWKRVADLMLSSARKLSSTGVDFIICPDNTIHQSFDLVIRESPLPWLHIAEEVASEALGRGFRKVGVLGTKYLMEGPVYPDKLVSKGISYLIPDDNERVSINEIIFEELVRGIFNDSSIARFQEIIAGLKSKGCDAVVLGCTEIPLIINDGNSSLPTLDSTRILARAALREAIEQS